MFKVYGKYGKNRSRYKRKWLYDKEMDYYWLWKLVDALKLGSFIMFYKDVLNVNINEEELSYCLK